eukprot:CAMPEP_0194228298 /NCGR_PEP_ID=MMETSP0156-20130528/43304_1 /TAXON_ID=33649 /ORGANISM="Thalassionema nitzschioides, Strain L26-B" /LENGTH=40 /DNA_ID= /DNA_START= /DNA_END= /DNA_ORIENTATION=
MRAVPTALFRGEQNKAIGFSSLFIAWNRLENAPAFHNLSE